MKMAKGFFGTLAIGDKLSLFAGVIKRAAETKGLEEK